MLSLGALTPGALEDKPFIAAHLAAFWRVIPFVLVDVKRVFFLK